MLQVKILKGKCQKEQAHLKSKFFIGDMGGGGGGETGRNKVRAKRKKLQFCKSHSDEGTSQKGLSVLNILSFLHPNCICTVYDRNHM